MMWHVTTVPVQIQEGVTECFQYLIRSSDAQRRLRLVPMNTGVKGNAGPASAAVWTGRCLLSSCSRRRYGAGFTCTAKVQTLAAYVMSIHNVPSCPSENTLTLPLNVDELHGPRPKGTK